jgi:hypothetical protein
MTRRVFCGLFPALLGSLVVGGLSGCSNDSKTNPALKVPDVPPSDRGGKAKGGGGPAAPPK